MITRYSVWINNKGLQDIDESIYITDIREKEPKQQVQTAARAWGDGLRLLRMKRESLSVVVRFAIREQNPARRRDICARIRTWAQEGYLTTSDRPGQRLYVVCEKLPTVDSALRWTREIELTFTAYDMPYWESTTPTKATVTANILTDAGRYDGYTSVRVAGDVKCPLDAVITATGATDYLRLYTADDQFIILQGLGMKQGDVLTISHDRRGILSMKLGNTSVMSKRTAKSYDDLMIPPNKTFALALRADCVCTATYTARGRSL